MQETVHFLIWVQRGAGLSRGRQDVDGKEWERGGMRERESERERKEAKGFYMEWSLRGE